MGEDILLFRRRRTRRAALFVGRSLTFVSSNATITPAITLSGDGPCQWEVTESDGHKHFYNTNSFSHTRSVAGNMTVRLLNTMQVAPYVTSLNLSGDGIISGIDSLNLSLFVNATEIIIQSNVIIGVPIITFGNIISRINVNVNSLSGDLSSVVLPKSAKFINYSSNFFTGLPMVSDSSLAAESYQGQSQGVTNMTQPRIDAFVTAWYSRWITNAFLFNCAVNIGGTNADPSGIYQNPFPNPPATPLEMVYVMVNDPFATGNKTQVWTY